MATFAENEVQVLPDYFPSELERIGQGLDSSILTQTINPNGPGQSKRAHDVNEARKRLRAFLRHASVTSSSKSLRELLERDKVGLYAHFAKREFDLARGVVDTLASLTPQPGLPAIDAKTIRLAQTRLPVTFTVITITGPRTEPVEHVRQVRLPGYAGPVLDDRQIDGLVKAREFITGGAERTFYVSLWRAECDAGLGGILNFKKAVERYAGLLPRAKTASVEIFGVQLDLFQGFVPVSLPNAPANAPALNLPGVLDDILDGLHDQISALTLTPRQRFVAIRSAFAHLALGDLLFRRRRTVSEELRAAVTRVYDAAQRLVRSSGTSADNPARGQISARASQQISKLQGHMNVLGLWDGFVPVQRFTVLEDLARQQIEVAAESADRFRTFLDEAEQRIGQLLDVQAEISAEEINQQISDLQVENASLTIDRIQEQIDLIDAQQDFLVAGSLAAGFDTVVKAAGKNGGGVLGAAAGLSTVTVDFFAQRNELGHQKEMAETERSIATNQASIAELQAQLSADRLAHLNEKLRFLEDRRLNADLMYLLASINEQRAERQLEGAVFLAYLFERALAFFLGKPDLRRIQFDYRDRPGGIFEAARALLEDFGLVRSERAALDQEAFDDFELSVSLRESYPLQFAQFLQTGRMDFIYSLYQLSKRQPAAHHCRLYAQAVQLVGNVPVTGFTGTLTHMGRFAVRDRDATLGPPPATRLIPTDEQVAEALQEQRRQGTAAAAVGGVLYYSLDPKPKYLSQDTQLIPPAPEQFTLDILEGLAPTGLWRLELHEFDRLQIVDVLLHFGVLSRTSDPFALQSTVKELIASYERELAGGDSLDRISAFSLRQQFPDAFFALEGGAATLTLETARFPNGLTNLRCKAVIAQALDRDGKGVPGLGLEISKPDAAYTRQRVTGEDGFSEDLTASPEILDAGQRFPVLGDWRVGLTDPGQFPLLGDLQLFLMYAFEEV